ncbi:MAG: arginyltransferase [Myxococcales bacterium]|nr:arginyltransferase [Myxococcales bacterium]
MSIPLLPGEPPELLVLDKPSRCPYLPERTARLPLRLPIRELSRRELDVRLASGDRRQGFVLYRPECPECQACEPIRIPVRELHRSRSLERSVRRGSRALTVEIGPPVMDARRVELYNAHKLGRGLSDEPRQIEAADYTDFLVASSCESFELRYLLAGSLVGVAMTDRAETALSAVYCYYDPAHENLGIGTFSIMKQVELCLDWGLDYLYLGLYIGECERMRYKARFLPHERLIGGEWRRFER